MEQPEARSTLVVSQDVDIAVPVEQHAAVSGEKGDRDLLVALAVLLVCGEQDLVELEAAYGALPAEERHAARSALHERARRI